jgi:cytochrome c553
MKPKPMRRVPAFAAALVQTLTLGLAVTVTQAQTDDVALGRQKAQACAVCHGPLGVSVAPDAPNLAGQPALYTAAQLRAYRSGARRHEVMAVISKPLSDDDIRQLAAWFSSLRVDVQPPP